MTNKEKESNSKWAILLCVCICLTALAGYFAGSFSKPEIINTRELDSLTFEINAKDKAYKILTDTIAKQNQVSLQKIDNVFNAIKKIHHGIQNQKQIIFSYPDSTFQRYIDSVRAGEGFN